MDKIELIEKYFDVKLLDCQKDFIRDFLDQKLYILPARHNGRINYRLLEAILEWKELNESKH